MFHSATTWWPCLHARHPQDPGGKHVTPTCTHSAQSRPVPAVPLVLGLAGEPPQGSENAGAGAQGSEAGCPLTGAPPSEEGTRGEGGLPCLGGWRFAASEPMAAEILPQPHSMPSSSTYTCTPIQVQSLPYPHQTCPPPSFHSLSRQHPVPASPTTLSGYPRHTQTLPVQSLYSCPLPTGPPKTQSHSPSSGPSHLTPTVAGAPSTAWHHLTAFVPPLKGMVG